MKKQFITTIIVLLNILYCFEIRAQDIRNNLNIISPGNSNYIHQNTENNNTWISVQTPSLTRYITDVFFIDSLYGWASHAGVGIGIFKTTNSGYSWDSVRLSPDASFLATIYFLDRNTGWTCGAQGAIRKTTDGGNTWIPKDYNQNIGFYKINFEDSLNGIIAGINTNYKAIILKTINGGNNWSSIYNSITNFSSIREHFWLNKDTAWFGGYYTFLKTTNSGNSFVDMYQYIPPPYGVLGICFINNDTGWISGNDGNGHNIYKTTNGGYNWVFQNNPVSGFSFPQINDILFISPDTGWATSLVGYILKTTNGGDEWFIDNSSNTEFSKLALYKNKKIWCGADFGQIWYSHIEKTTGIQNNNSVVSDFNLYQNYPNPFNPETTIKFQINKPSSVKLNVYDLKGNLVKKLYDSFLQTGTYDFIFNGSFFSSGIYFYRLESEFNIISKRMLLLK